MHDYKGKKSKTSRFFKVFGIFAGLQSLTVLCALVRTKFISYWIGPAGIGLNAIYIQSVDLFNLIFNQGIRNAAIKDLSSSGDRLYEGIIKLRKLGQAGGVLLMLLFAAVSPLISLVVSGNMDSVFEVLPLSTCVWAGAYTACEYAIMQSCGEIKKLARASAWGVLISTVTSLPLFYYLEIKSIMPVIVFFFMAMAFFAWIYRVVVPKEYCHKVTLEEVRSTVGPMLKLSGWLTASALITVGCSYVFTVYLNLAYSGSVLGYFQAGFTVLNTYLGVVFAALSMEYFPRLSVTGGSIFKARPMISQQCMLITTIVCPAVLIFILFSGQIMSLLYRSQFEIMQAMVILGAPGIIARAVSYCLAYEIIIKGDGKTYLACELASGLCFITLNILFFKYWSYAGLGVAYTLWYLIYTALIATVCHKKYGLNLPCKVWIRSLICLGLSLATGVGTFIWQGYR